MKVKSTAGIKANTEIDSVAAQLSLSPLGIQLKLMCCEPNSGAISNYRKGIVEFALFLYQGVLFFLCKFGDGDWLDAPFHAYINPPDLRGFIDGFVADKHDVALAVVLCDEHGNQKFGARLVTIGKKFSAKLQEIVKMQVLNSISISDYERRIQAAFSKFTPEQMVSRAVAKSIGGQDDAAANDGIDEEKLQGKTHTRYPLVEKFTHITWNSGHECLQTASDINDISKNFCLKLICDSEKTGWVDMNLDREKYPIHIAIDGDILICKLCFPTSPGETPQPAIIIVVALDATHGKETWKQLNKWSDIYAKATGTKIPDMPSMPWIVAAIMPALDAAFLAGNSNSAMLHWAGDFERVLAFAFSCYMSAK